jgi:CDP-diglyceride synthetase
MINNMTQFEHFKKNYLGTLCIFVASFFIVLTMEIIRESETWWISFFFLGIAASLPIGNYFSWKKKFKK